MASVAVVFRKDKLNKKNRAPIHFRIIKHRKVRYIASGLIIDQRFWDFRRNRIKIRHPNSNRFNSYLTNKFNELQDQVFEYETKHVNITTRQLKNHILGKKPTLFFPFAMEIVEDHKRNKKFGTYDKNKSVMTKLSEYVNKETFVIQDINYNFLIKYERWLIKKKGNKVNTIGNSMKFFRTVINHAIRQEIMKTDQSPFNKYIIKTKKSEKQYLSEEELKLIEDLKLTPFTRIDTHRDMFVFASYVGGLRISDVLQLEWSTFNTTHLDVTTRKTGSQISLKVPKVALAILSKYKTKYSENDMRFIFPILENDIDLEDKEYLDKVISRSTCWDQKACKYSYCTPYLGYPCIEKGNHNR